MQATWLKWVDSAGVDGWVHRTSVTHGTHVCFSVGWIVDEDDEAITLAGHVSCDRGRAQSFSGMISIPKLAILERAALQGCDLVPPNK